MLFSIKQIKLKSDTQLWTNMNLNEGVQWRILKTPLQKNSPREKLLEGSVALRPEGIRNDVDSFNYYLPVFALNIRRLETSYFYKFCDKTDLAIPLRQL